MTLAIIILAAGNGTRMQSDTPKVLQTIGGKPLLSHSLHSARQLKPSQLLVVHNPNHYPQLCAHFPESDITWVAQTEQLGTGHALAQALPHVAPNQRVLCLLGDTPLLQPTTLNALVNNTPTNHLGLLSAVVDNPNGLGRIIRNTDGAVSAIVEDRDASAEQRNIQEIFSGVLTAPADFLRQALPQLSNDNDQGEYYLTDVIAHWVATESTAPHCVQAANQSEVFGINTLAEKTRVERHYQLQLAQQLIEQGVWIADPNRFDCRGELTAQPGARIDINAVFCGKVSLASGASVSANCCLTDCQVGENVQIHPNSVLNGAIIEAGAQVGPFAHIRPGTHLQADSKIGSFVEVKNSQVGTGSKANHLAYLGDAVIGAGVNIGAGVITCNYDGANKHHTMIEDAAFIGSGSQLIAPVTIETGAYIGAGSTISRTAPADKLSLTRSKQTTLDGWKPPAQANAEKSKR